MTCGEEVDKTSYLYQLQLVSLGSLSIGHYITNTLFNTISLYSCTMADTEEPQPDPVEGEGEKNEKSDAKKSSFPKRYIVAIMIFLGICVQYALRVNLSVAIGAMCNNHTIEQNGFTIQKVRFLAVKA